MQTPPIGRIDLGYCEPDKWPLGELVYREGNEWYDTRISTGQPWGITSLAVRIEITGKKYNRHGMLRCRVIFPQDDGEPDIVSGGWWKTNGNPPLNATY